MPGYIEKLKRFVDRQSSPIVLRRELSGICSESQMSRLLKRACAEGFLIHVSRGVYVKARIGRVTGKPVPAVNGGFSQVVRLVLARLGIEYAESDAWYEYQTGQSKQVPANSALYVPRSCSRKIELGGMKATLTSISRKRLSDMQNKNAV